MTPSDTNKNPATLPTTECVEWCWNFYKDFIQQCNTAGLIQRWRADWWRYHNLEEGNRNISSDLMAAGTQGEKVQMSVNVERNIIQHRHTMITSTRPVVDPFAENMDPDSLRQVDVARGVADYYLLELKYGDHPKAALLMADVLGFAYNHGRWDAAGGKPFAAPPDENGTPVYVFPGEPVVSTRGPADVAFDLDVQAWSEVKKTVVREWQNKYDLAAAYKDKAEQIIDSSSTRRGAAYDREELPRFTRYQSTTGTTSDLLEVHYAYFWKTASNPHGRRVVYVAGDADRIMLEDGPLEQDEPPLIRFVSDESVQTPIALGMGTALAQLQQCIDKVWSAVSTRIFTSGVNNFLVDRAANIDVSETEGGNGWIEYDRAEDGSEPIKVLDNFKIPPEMFKGLELLTGSAEMISAMNATARGTPPPGVNAGVAIAQLEAKAMQFASTLEKSYVEGLEKLTMFIFDSLREHPQETQARVIHIVGRGERAKVMDFYAKDISGIRKVRVTIGNPMSRTVSGRYMMADYLRNSSTPITSEQMMAVLDFGRLEPVTAPGVTEMMLIYTENERLSDPAQSQPIVVMRGQNHALHIKHHLEILNNPDVIFDPNIQNAVAKHLAEHEQMWMMGDPLLGIASGQIPMGAGAMQPQQEQQAPPGKPPPNVVPIKGAPPPPTHAQAGPNGVHPHPPKANPGELREVLEPPPMSTLNPRPQLAVRPQGS